MNIRYSLPIGGGAKSSRLRAIRLFAFSCLISFSLCLTSCAEEVNTTTSKVAAGKSMSQIMEVIPEVAKVTWILDGTDMLPNSDIKRVSGSAEVQWAGSYRSEQGGSILTLKITAKSSNHWNLVRNYSEPALKPESKNYELRNLYDGLVSKAGNLAVQKTHEGVLVLELESGLDSIPASYWIHYITTK